MQAVIDTAAVARIADMAPGAAFWIGEDPVPHRKVDGTSPHLESWAGKHYSFHRGRIVEHEADAEGRVLGLSRTA